MDKAALVAEVEKFSKLGALKVHQKDLQKALEAYRHAFQSVLLLGHNGYMQRACSFNLGAVYISTGSYTEGLTYLQKAEPPEGHHDGSSNGDLYFNYGLAYEGLRNTADMKHYYSKALKEYQLEKDNVKMEAEVISRLGKVCVASGHYYEAESYVKQLIHIYEKLKDFVKQLQTQVEQASLLLKVDNLEEAEKIADHCFMRVQDQELTSKTAHIFIELSLVYTQLCKYHKALECCQSALQIVNTKDSDLKQIAVLYQNLGAIYNYLGQYKDAIEYHQAAASKYAESNNRKSQGHCFINLGYAYSQLNDINRAGEYYLHSLQAAKDCGDRKSEWQSLEALGSVSCYQGDLQRSQDYYKSAFTVLAKSPDAEDMVAQDRILEKITKVIHLKGHKPDELVDITKQEEINNHRLPSPHRRQTELLKKVISKDESIIAVRKDGKVKYLRVRRSGTLQKFNKVALGLDVSTSPILERKSFGLDIEDTDEDEVFSASTIYFTDSEEEKEKDDGSEADRDVNQSRQSQKISDICEVVDTEEVITDSEDDEKNLVLEAMREVADNEDERGTSPHTEKTTGKHNPGQEGFSQDDAESEDDTEDDDSSLQSTEEEEENTHKGRDKHQVPPHIPTMPPMSSYFAPIRTYEVPVKSNQALVSTDEDGNNFFCSANRVPLFRKNVMFKDSDEEAIEKNKLKESGDSKIYESIRLSSLEGNTDPLAEDNTINLSESEDKDVAHDQLPKGKRDRIEYDAFKADMKTRRDKENKTEINKTPVKKPSRMCSVM